MYTHPQLSPIALISSRISGVFRPQVVHSSLTDSTLISVPPNTLFYESSPNVFNGLMYVVFTHTQQ